MNNADIIKKAINKAVKNGWHEGEAQRNLLEIYPRYAGKTSLMKHYYRSIIFSHSFAKAFWYCEHKIESYIGGSYKERCKKCKAIRLIGSSFDDWLYHLQQMVLEQNPLQYIEKFLK